MIPPDLASALTEAGARLGPFAQRVRWYASVASTNDLILDLADEGVSEGAVAVADSQTGGRGRHGRTWYSPRGAGLYVSVLLRPDPDAASLLTLAAGVAVADGLEAVTGLRPTLKWPNDVWCGGRKLGGILAEARALPSPDSHVALGFGINLLRTVRPRALADRATSLEEELGRPVDRGAVLAECLAALATRYAQLAVDRGGVIAAWREAARALLRRSVEWGTPDGPMVGVAEDIDDSGALLVRTRHGVERIIAGEVRWH